MPRDERRSERERLVEKLYDALGEEGVEDVDSMKVSLSEEGVDVDRAIREGKGLFSDFLKRQKLARAREKLVRIRSAVSEFVKSSDLSLDRAREEIARALAGDRGEEAYQAYHRKLGSVEEEDVKSLADDAALLEFVRKIEEGE